ncbi:MAG: transposase [Burkholderiaceae bacterium]|nr:transposase [Burkholderiaceae bacterium]
MAADGTLPEHLAQLVPIANARSGKSGKRSISRRAIYSWMQKFNEVADNGARANQAVNALAPKDAHSAIKVPVWAPVMLNLYQQPQGVSLAWVCREMEPLLRQQGIKIPSYDVVRRFLGKMGNVERQVGRMGSRQIKNIKPFVRRDASVLWPGEVYTADGHCFDAEIAHPNHGRPFRPEITSVLDVNTRRCVGWSVDLAESGLAVLEALRNACETAGICALFYVDNGSGYHNAVISAPGTGLTKRLGITMTHSIAYNSQARGIIERSHQTIWIEAAKELPTYIGATMDAQAKQVVHKLTRKDVKAAGKSKLLMGFPEFVKFCEIRVAAYNARPHRSLPKIWDEELGKKRHMTPNEAWTAGVAEGATIDLVLENESQDLFRPQKQVAVRRGELQLFGTWYFSKELEQHHGEAVRVGYDVRNAERVWVYDQEGRFLCAAGLKANLRDYFPKTVREQAHETRAKGRLRRIDAKRDEVLEELAGCAPRDIGALELADNPVINTLKFTGLELVEADFARGTPEAPAATAARETPAPAKRPLFCVESERYEWLMQHQAEWTLNDAHFLQRYLAEQDGYALLAERFELLGMEWNEEKQQALNAFVITADQNERSA